MEGNRKIIVFDGKRALVDFAVRLWREVCIMTSSRSELMNVALSGGHTPIDFYKALAEMKDGSAWKKIHIFLVDERFVPPTDDDSNLHMIREILLNNVPIPQDNVHPMRTTGLSPDEAALEYERDLVRHFNLKQGEFPIFDFILLGLGEDGHIASLFPGSPAVPERDRCVMAVKPERARHQRITLTLPVINNSRSVVFLVAGAEKEEVLKRTAERNDPDLPGALVNPPQGSLFFLADRSAAGLLSEEIYVAAER